MHATPNATTLASPVATGPTGAPGSKTGGTPLPVSCRRIMRELVLCGALCTLALLPVASEALPAISPYMESDANATATNITSHVTDTLTISTAPAARPDMVPALVALLCGCVAFLAGIPAGVRTSTARSHLALRSLPLVLALATGGLLAHAAGMPAHILATIPVVLMLACAVRLGFAALQLMAMPIVAAASFPQDVAQRHTWLTPCIPGWRRTPELRASVPCRNHWGNRPLRPGGPSPRQRHPRRQPDLCTGILRA